MKMAIFSANSFGLFSTDKEEKNSNKQGIQSIEFKESVFVIRFISAAIVCLSHKMYLWDDYQDTGIEKIC